MIKVWKKTGEGMYDLFLDQQLAGKMQLAFNSSENLAECRVGEQNFIISRIGFWKNALEITDNNGQLILKKYYDKWYANSSVLEYNGKKYRLIVHNNPLAEWAIMENDQIILAYGLDTDNGKTQVKISGLSTNNNLLFDLLLWYLFVPVATESMGDSFTFYLLLN